jgi:hypothetical protein
MSPSAVLAAATQADPLLLPTWIGALGTAAGAAVATAAVIVAVVQLRHTATHLTEDSEARTRPYVGIDVVPGIQGAPMLDLVIQNFGQSAARNITISLVDAAFEAQREGDVIGPALGRLFGNPFELAPGARRRVLWHGLESPQAKPSGAIGAPAKGQIRVEYEWCPEGSKRLRHYEDTICYDLTEYPKLIPQASGGPEASGSGPEALAKNVVHALRRIATNVADLGR